MSNVWIISMSLLWLAVIVLTVLVLLLYRQFGLAYMSGRAKAGLQGLDLGARARPVALTALDGTGYAIDWSAAPQDGATVLLFAQPSCPICGDLARDAAGLPGVVAGIEVRLGGRHDHWPAAARRRRRTWLDRRHCRGRRGPPGMGRLWLAIRLCRGRVGPRRGERRREQGGRCRAAAG